MRIHAAHSLVVIALFLLVVPAFASINGSISGIVTDPSGAFVEGQSYFNPDYFTTEPIGQIGNANRRFFSGPGLNNFDMALLKTTNITESKILQLRVEAFNISNHAQFYNPDGNINGGLFGIVTSARSSRLLQLAAKFTF